MLAGAHDSHAWLGGMGGRSPWPDAPGSDPLSWRSIARGSGGRARQPANLDEAGFARHALSVAAQAAPTAGPFRSALSHAAEIVPELARRGEHFDLVHDHTARMIPLTGYVPAGLR